MCITSRLNLDDLNIPKNTTKVAFIKYFNDKTVVFNNDWFVAPYETWL